MTVVQWISNLPPALKWLLQNVKEGVFGSDEEQLKDNKHIRLHVRRLPFINDTQQILGTYTSMHNPKPKTLLWLLLYAMIDEISELYVNISDQYASAATSRRW